MKYSLLTLLVCITFFCNAQDSLKTISGKIIDLTTKEPIDFVIVNDLNTNKTIQSNHKGEFEINGVNKKTILVFSKLGYQTQAVSVYPTTKLPLIVNLKIQSKDLSEVVITAAKSTKRLVKNSFYVSDYQFIANNILLLGEINDKTVLKLINKDGKELQRLTVNNFKSDTLVKDCFNNIHLLTENNTIQVFINNNNINLLDNVRRSLFDSLLRPCILNTNDNLYFQHIYNQGQMKTIFVINKTTKQKSDFGIFSDAFKMDMLKNEESFMYQKYGYTADNTMGELSPDDLRASRRKEDDINFAKKFIYTAAYIPIILNNDTITVFDHPNDLIHRYSLNNTEVNLETMEYHHYKNWKPQIIGDEFQHKFYTTYLHDGIVTMGEINLATGKINKRFKLQHPFPKNIKVENGVVYYLYRLKDTEDRTALYALEID